MVLQTFAHHLEGFFNRGGDITARFGGDEFAAFVGRPLTVAEVDVMLRKFVGRVRDVFEELYPGEGVTVSVGAAFVPGLVSLESLYRQTDAALYDAKRGGKNCFLISEGPS